MSKAAPKILFVEDDTLVLTLYKRLLESQGFEVHAATDGIDAVNTLTALQPDLVVLDLMLPKLDGGNVVRFMRSRDGLRSTPVLVLSNLLFSEVAQEAARFGANRVISKAECTPKRLLAAVHELLAGDSEVDDVRSPGAEAHSQETLLPTLDTRLSMADSPGPEAPIPALAGPAQIEVNPRNGSAVVSPPTAAPDALLREAQAYFLEQGLEATACIRKEFQAFIQSPASAEGRTHLDRLYREVEAVHTGAERTMSTRVALLAGALRAALGDVRAKPAALTPSMLRSLTQAVDSLRLVFQGFRPGAEAWGPKPKALVVEDDPICARMAVAALERASLDPVATDRPETALRLARENRYDVILLDIDLPGINGHELCRWVRLLPNHAQTPVIFVTASSDFQSRAESVASGGNGFITKPVCASELALKSIVHALQGWDKTPAATATMPPPGPHTRN